jgi:hypothetical protein
VYSFICLSIVANTYGTPPSDQTKGKVVDQPSTSTPPSSNPLQIEKLIFDAVLHPPKSAIPKATFNTNSHAAQNFNIVEDLAQSPYSMSSLEVLQTYPSQCRTMFSAIGAMDPEE